jgi:NifU-like protein involved in Fe-S cluster formation
MYSSRLLDHFENPRNAGELACPDLSAERENPVCGDVLRFTLKVAGGRIAEIRFLAKGCVATIACASALTELVRQREIDAARGLQPSELVGEVGGLPKTSIHACQLAIDTLAAALAGFRG